MLFHSEPLSALAYYKSSLYPLNIVNLFLVAMLQINPILQYGDKSLFQTNAQLSKNITNCLLKENTFNN